MDKRICSVDGCEKKHRRGGYCDTHSQRVRKYGSPHLPNRAPQNSTTCSGPECDRSARTHGLCQSHYSQESRGKALAPLETQPQLLGRPDRCTFAGCDRPHKARGLCKQHASQARAGQTLKPIAEYLGKIPCSHDSCNRVQIARGLCAHHYSKTVDKWRRHGITRERGLAIYESQHSSCAICETPAPIESLFVDHDHSCCPGIWGCQTCIRGLLCRACNFAIGQMSDDPIRLVAAARYLTTSAKDAFADQK